MVENIPEEQERQWAVYYKHCCEAEVFRYDDLLLVRGQPGVTGESGKLFDKDEEPCFVMKLLTHGSYPIEGR